MNKKIIYPIIIIIVLMLIGAYFLILRDITPPSVKIVDKFEFINCSSIPYLTQVAKTPSDNAKIERYENQELPKNDLFFNITLYKRISGKYKNIVYVQESIAGQKFGKVTFGDFFETDESLPSSKIAKLAQKLEENKTYKFDFYLTETPFNPERPEEYIRSFCIKKN